MKMIYRFLFLVIIISGCSKDPELTDDMLGGGVIFDPSIYNPEEFLISHAIPNPTPEQAMTPVIIASHGYTATTFEWNEFRQYADAYGGVYVSQVLLGGHGGKYEDFRNSSWRDWQSAIIMEYDRLVQAGFQNIHFLGSSTSGALFLELLSGNHFNGKPAPGQVMLIDPIVIPSNKSLSMIHIFGPMLGYLETDQTSEEDKVWFRYRPEETLRELQNLISKVRKDLEEGFVLPQGTSLKVYKSIKDSTADPVSAVLIKKGVKTFSGDPIDVELIDSNLHVYTRLELRQHTAADKQNQISTFNDIIERVLND